MDKVLEANQAGSNEMLEQQVANADAKAEALMSTIAALEGAQSTEEVIRGALDAIRTAYGWHYACFWSTDSQTQVLSYEIESGVVPAEFRREVRNATFGAGESVCGQVWQSGRIAHERDLERFDDCPHLMIASQRGFESVVALPIGDRDACLGVCEFYLRSNDKYNAEQAEILEAIARLISVTVAGLAATPDPSHLLDLAPINVLLVDTAGNTQYMNEAARTELQLIAESLPTPAEKQVGAPCVLIPTDRRAECYDPSRLPLEMDLKIGRETIHVKIVATFDSLQQFAGPMVVWEVVTSQRAQEKHKRETHRRKQDAQETVQAKVDDLLRVVNAAAKGDLTVSVDVEGDDAVAELARGMASMIADLRDLISQVVEGAAQFTEGSRIVAESAQTVAQGAQTQSASIQQMSASVEELTRSIEAVNDNTSEANLIAKQTSDLADQGGTAVRSSVEAMERIKSSSSQISEIIQVISDIASQTNLLALNAAIEAARAGEHGLGFAVVADEVRKLAERSSEAAKEISLLIRESTQRVEEGSLLSAQTGESLSKIIEGVDSTARKISEIAAATVEQAQNANEVANAIHLVSQVTEQSAAGSEEMASSSEELGAQAASLRDLVSRFKTSN